MRVEEADIPQDGVYAGYPTFAGPRRTIAAHVLDFDVDLYGRRVEVGAHHRLRGMIAFRSAAELVDAVADDVVRVGRLLRFDGPDPSA